MMKVLGIVGSVFGTKTRIAMQNIKFSDGVDYEIVDLSELDIMFADGRDFRDFEGDTRTLVEKIIAADAIIVGTPVFQASIPGALKNVFDLLPVDSIKDKVVGIVVTAGSPRHYLVAEYQLKPVLTYMKAALLEKYVFIEGRDFLKEDIIEDDVHFRLRNLARQVENRVDQIKKEYEARYDF
ncbi:MULTISPECIES: NADPH-dependent FMN reductase [Erysipelothrix]|uniref:NADPH-dependent FMN reductase n=1 Tax=Erysipelothrix TaxID=1647 RepID=UPI0019163BFB|nr:MULTISPECIES: NADPH-dependent FMN reductase [Erysipelothrix]